MTQFENDSVVKKGFFFITNDLDTLLSEKSKFHLILKKIPKLTNNFWLDKHWHTNVNFDFTTRFLLKYQRSLQSCHINQRVIPNQLTYKCRYGHNTYENEIHKANCKGKAEVMLLRLNFFMGIIWSNAGTQIWYLHMRP